jgi:hypothetical protein
MNPGLKLELDYSIEFHQSGVPLLVSATLLRARNLGQIDLARISVDREGWVIEIGEVKSSSIGLEQMERAQKRRLFSSQHFLSGIFGHRSRLLSMAKK